MIADGTACLYVSGPMPVGLQAMRAENLYGRKSGERVMRTVLWVLLVMLLNGCAASISRAPSDIKSPSSYQQSSTYGEIVYVKWLRYGDRKGLKIDGKFIGSLGNEDEFTGAYYIVQLKPGDHELILFYDYNDLKDTVHRDIFRIKAGERKYYFDTGFSEHGWKADVDLTDKDFLGYVTRDTDTALDSDATSHSKSSEQSLSVTSSDTISFVTAIDQRITNINKPLHENRYALIIGINRYKHQTDVAYADNSARSFKLAAKHILGIPDENIILLIDKAATSGSIKSQLEVIRMLPDPGDELFVYFAGHGVPGKDGYTYLLPYDMGADAIHLEKRLQLEQLYKQLADSKAKKVYVFMETCFSGRDDQGQLVYKGVAPVLKKRKTKIDSSKINIMSAGGHDDFANQKADEKQRLFTYYLLKGLSEDKTDINDLYSYVRKKVKRDSLKLGVAHKQIPQLNSEAKDN
jgi:hypothetical protein